jgi:hypothetical protein
MLQSAAREVSAFRFHLSAWPFVTMLHRQVFALGIFPQSQLSILVMARAMI